MKNKCERWVILIGVMLFISLAIYVQINPLALLDINVSGKQLLVIEGSYLFIISLVSACTGLVGIMCVDRKGGGAFLMVTAVISLIATVGVSLFASMIYLLVGIRLVFSNTEQFNLSRG